MKRRDFLASSLAATGAAIGGALDPFARIAAAADDFADVKITRVVGFDLLTRRDKLVGRNSRLDVHGDRSMDRMLRISTSSGVEALGPCRAGEEQVAQLLGRPALSFFARDERRMNSPLGRRSTALWDLAGRLLEKPVYELLGGAGGERVPVYDGSIYFMDLLPQRADNWRDQLRREIDAARADGHRAVKVKIGRGKRWMERAAGDARDIEVVQLIRAHAGQDFAIGVDANNGYDLAGARRFLSAAGPLKIAFVEEMFPETVEDCLAMKAFIAEQGWQTKVADGESQRAPEAFRLFVEAAALDVLQGDMKHFGFELILAEAALAAEKPGILVAPHNWGSLLGYYMQLHVGRAIDNFYMAEHDPLKTDVLRADGYTRRDGYATVPDRPGLGLAIDEAKFADDVKINFDLRA
ncbi:MAG: hypothetical protein DWQ31_04970 [Planctomycetota bacterium]|nr:MAG: hypothetical protein DWQ31_04970 [Planctomycetota bacterium]REJ87888.1 MAG: hypothetical protein DWQ35_20860 [Planctomycetota bacterium]